MLSFHHVNLGVPPGGADAEAAFLVNILGYKRLEPPPDLASVAIWFESDDAKQIHLSEDPGHRPAARAHVAVEVGDTLAALEDRLTVDDHQYEAIDGAERRIVLCQDPAGNRWELRGTPCIDSRLRGT
jgi:catechol 2,3-dioxygenase-like lactoylglutathione lyase family enzyme